MPHSTAETNGETPSPNSKTLNHLSSYPTVATGIDTFKSHPYGKRSIELVDQAYTRFGKPVEPYLETPYQITKPYLNKADELGDKALGTVEGHFPIVKEKPETIWETGKSWAFWPYKYASETWDDEYTKTARERKNQAGLFTLISALVSFQMRVVSDALTIAANWAKPKYDESKKKTDEYVREGQSKLGEARGYAEDKLGQAKQVGQDYLGLAQQKADQLQDGVKNGASQTKEQARETKEKAEKKAK